MISVRPATPDDAPAMAAVLNEIIAVGGTTAFLDPVSAEDILGWMAQTSERSSWHVAEVAGNVLGFQYAMPNDTLPKDAIDIASFVKIGVTGKGIGRKLLAATTERCKSLGYSWINATIRADNASGLRYYSAMGFVDWHTDPEAKLSDGRVTGKISKRLML